jgi:hypothetical protein
MFLLDTLLLLSPLAIYTFVRVRQQIATRRNRMILLAATLIVALGYPLAETLSHSTAGAWAKPVMIAGYCSLPFLLYLVLAVLASDSVVGILRLLKVVARETTNAPRFRRFRLALWLIVPVLIVTIGLVNHQRLQVSEYDVEVLRKSSKISCWSDSFLLRTSISMRLQTT